jgi:transcriptional regulator with XRE-family HTH domain
MTRMYQAHPSEPLGLQTRNSDATLDTKQAIEEYPKMDADMIELADLVKRTRKARRLGQQEVAELAGVSLNTLGNFERHLSVPQPTKLRQILDVLDLTSEAGDAVASATRGEFSPDIKTFLDVMGLFLTALPEGERTEVMFSITRQIVNR